MDSPHQSMLHRFLKSPLFPAKPIVGFTAGLIPQWGSQPISTQRNLARWIWAKEGRKDHTPGRVRMPMTESEREVPGAKCQASVSWSRWISCSGGDPECLPKRTWWLNPTKEWDFSRCKWGDQMGHGCSRRGDSAHVSKAWYKINNAQLQISENP